MRDLHFPFVPAAFDQPGAPSQSPRLTRRVESVKPDEEVGARRPSAAIRRGR